MTPQLSPSHWKVLEAKIYFFGPCFGIFAIPKEQYSSESPTTLTLTVFLPLFSGDP